MRAVRLALVGPGQQENLALEYLAASAKAAGHVAEIVRFDGRWDADKCVRSIMDFNAEVVGLGIAFQHAVDDYLKLASILRASGYKGHMTCGGHVPTFCYREILESALAIDTIVRHEGEQTLVELLDTIGDEKKPSAIPGLVWREQGELKVGPARPLATDLDELPLPERQKDPFVVGGIPMAFMIASRGCIGECAYCSIRAFAKDASGPRYRMRSADSVAEEIAKLRFEYGVRVILMQDDLFILPDEGKTLERLEAITRAIRIRGVEKMLFWIKGRPEAITESVLEAAREMGAIHLFLGVESASLERLRYLGRSHTPLHNEKAISMCLSKGIRPSFNFMLFDPDCTLEDVATTIDFASRYLELPWNVCRTEVYSGTRLLDRLRKQGRLQGDWRAYGYAMRDSRAEVMFRIMRIAFDKRAFAFDSLLNKLITLSFARHVHEELSPILSTVALSGKIDELVTEVYRDTVDELKRILEFSARADSNDLDKNRDFAIETAMAMNERDNPRLTRCEELFDLLDAKGAKIRKNI